MSDVKPIPDGYEGVIPYMVVENASDAIDFYKKAFGAKETARVPAPDGDKLMHAEIKIGNSFIFLCDDFPEWSGKSRTPQAFGGSPIDIHLYVADIDKIVNQAREAGAKVTMEPKDMFWGDRHGRVVDPYGHGWSFSTHVRDVPAEEMKKAAEEMFAKKPA